MDALEAQWREGYAACTADAVAWLAANLSSDGGACGQTMENTVAMEWARENRRTLVAVARCIKASEHIGAAGKLKL